MNMKGKNNILAGFMVILALLSVAVPQVTYATDYFTLEALIKNHKRQSDRLAARTAERLALTDTGRQEKDTNSVYTNVAKELSKRTGDLLGYMTFGADMVNIALQIDKLVDLETKVIDNVIETSKDHPYILIVAADIEYEVGERLAEVARYSYYVLSASVGITLATQADRLAFTSTIKGALTGIRNRLWDLKQECHKAVLFGKKGLLGATEDIIKSAKKSQEQASRSVINLIKEAVENRKDKDYGL